MTPLLSGQETFIRGKFPELHLFNYPLMLKPATHHVVACPKTSQDTAGELQTCLDGFWHSYGGPSVQQPRCLAATTTCAEKFRELVKFPAVRVTYRASSVGGGAHCVPAGG
jgi:hypothetical protein